VKDVEKLIKEAGEFINKIKEILKIK